MDFSKLRRVPLFLLHLVFQRFTVRVQSLLVVSLFILTHLHLPFLHLEFGRFLSLPRLLLLLPLLRPLILLHLVTNPDPYSIPYSTTATTVIQLQPIPHLLPLLLPLLLSALNHLPQPKFLVLVLT